MALAAIAALVMIFLSTSRRKGLHRFAGGLLFTGVILILSGLFLRPAFEKLNTWSTSSLGAQASFTQNIIDPMFREINITYSRYSIIFGIAYTIPALITYGILIITREKKDGAEIHEHEHTSTHDRPPSTDPELEHAQQSPAEPPQVPIPAPAIATNQSATQPEQKPISRPIEPVRPRAQQGSRSYERRPPMIQG
jgi:hypothetical protein